VIAVAGPDCAVPDCPGDPNCNGQGYCNATVDPPRCSKCDTNWFGADCSRPCIYGEHNLENTECVCNTTCHHGVGCDIQCSDNGVCDEQGECYCDPMVGWRGTWCEVPGCPRDPSSDEDCTGHGDCNTEARECTCYAGWTGLGCHIPDCPGVPDCNDRGYCNATFDTPMCTNCSGPWMGPACADPCVNGVETPKDSRECVCDPGWAGVGCDSECSGHGKIVNGACVCDYESGYKGALCDIAGCPGLFFLDCSGRGRFQLLFKLFYF